VELRQEPAKVPGSGGVQTPPAPTAAEPVQPVTLGKGGDEPTVAPVTPPAEPIAEESKIQNPKSNIEAGLQFAPGTFKDAAARHKFVQEHFQVSVKTADALEDIDARAVAWIRAHRNVSDYHARTVLNATKLDLADALTKGASAGRAAQDVGRESILNRAAGDWFPGQDKDLGDVPPLVWYAHQVMEQIPAKLEPAE
jgi:hypothetical protein